MLPISVGLEHDLQSANFKKWQKQPGLLNRKILKYIRLFTSRRLASADGQYPDSRKLMVGIESGILKPVTNINAISAGFEISYDGSYAEKISRYDLPYDPWILSLPLGHAFLFGNFSFTQQLAWYVYKPFPSTNHSFFQRYGIYYQVGKLINMGFSLKVHGHVAEHFDIHVGALW